VEAGVALELGAGALDLLRRDAARGACHRHRLEREACLVGVAQIVDVELLDARATVGDMDGEPERLELSHGLADRRDARAERARELLEPQRTARLELAREDPLTQLGRRRVRQRCDPCLHVEARRHRDPMLPADHVSSLR
jgi:hypothetical protein